MAPATSKNPSAVTTLHFLRKAHESPLRSFPRRVRGGLSQHLRQFLIAEIQFDLSDDRLTVLGLEALERPFVSLQSLVTDGFIERRPSGCGFDSVQRGGLWLAPLPAQLIEQPIPHGLPQVSLKRADATGLKVSDPLERLQKGVLDKVVRVNEVAGPLW
jgi:hypothetical protein